MDIDFERDYVWKNTKALPSVFHAFDNNDMVKFLSDHGIETVVEKNGRVMLRSGKAKHLLDLLLKLSLENGVEIQNNAIVESVDSIDDGFNVLIEDGEYACKRVIVSTWGKSYPQVGATWFVYDIANKFSIEYIDPYPCLCGMETLQDMSPVTGNSVELRIQLLQWKKCVYDQEWSVLFTHWWISGPLVFDSTLRVWKSKDIQIKLLFDLGKTNKKLITFFGLDEKNPIVELDMKRIRPREEAKVMWGGVVMSSLKKFESKEVPGLYFVGEACDITGRTWGYNLQWARSSWYGVAQQIHI